MNDMYRRYGLRGPATGAPFDIVYVEDDPRLRMMYRVNLEADGCTVREAGDAQTALELVRERLPDILLADIYMPGMTGVELAEIVRQEFGQALPIVFLSANLQAYEEELLRALSNDYLQKPFSPTLLASRLREVVHSRSTADV